MEIELRYGGYSFVEYQIGDTTLFMDPTFSRYDQGWWDNRADVRPCDIVALTAGDFDHYLDALDVLEDSSAQLVGSPRMCRAVGRKLDLPDDRLIRLDSGEAARTADFRLLAYKVVPDRLRWMWAEFARRPFDLPALMYTYYSARPDDPGRAYVIEIGERRLYHFGSSLNSELDWKKIRAFDNHSAEPILVIGCLRDNHDEIIRAIRLFDPKTVFLYLAREDIYRRLRLSRDTLDEFIAEITAAVGDRVELVGLSRGSVATIDMGPVSNVPRPWDLRQEMVALSLLAYTGSATVHDDPARVGELICGFLDQYSAHMGHWEFVWGPAVAPGKIADLHLAFMVRHREQPNEVALVIRGTNPLALENIIVEVDGISTQVPWPYSGSRKIDGSPMIAEGVAHGLEGLLGMTPPAGLPGEGQDILTYLHGVQTQLDDDTEVHLHVTGHSLGGTLASTLALLLQDALDNQVLSKQIGLKLADSTVIGCYAVAGFTPGNADFARFFNATVKEHQRIYNTLDAVPLMYAKQDLERVPALYKPDLRSVLMSIGVKSTIKKLDDAGLEYTQVMADAPGLPGTLSTTTGTYIAEMLWQHTEGYVELLDLEDCIDVMAILEAK